MFAGALMSVLILFCAPAWSAPEPPRTFGEVLDDATEDDWASIPPEDLLVLRIGGHDVVIELAPAFAPKNVANVRTLVTEDYFDGLAIVRSQDNYVVQWADPEASRPLGSARERVKVELDQPLRKLAVTRLDATDAYADQVGFVDGFPVAAEGKRVWLTHCYGMVGVARGDAADSGNGSSLYVVTGHAPRHLDRNITLVGRVIDNIEVLSTMPRGSGPLGFYEGDDVKVPLESAHLASELPMGERPVWQRLRTDTETFAALVASRQTRSESWFLDPVGRIGLCNMPLPRRQAPASAP